MSLGFVWLLSIGKGPNKRLSNNQMHAAFLFLKKGISSTTFVVTFIYGSPTSCVYHTVLHMPLVCPTHICI